MTTKAPAAPKVPVAANAPAPPKATVALSDYDLTVEQLAAEVSMSIRNIRNHHTRGLLPAPEVRARVGYYNAEHVARLRLILDLQADGFNLAAIERLLSGSDGLAERLLGLRAAVTTPYEPEAAEFITAEEVAALGIPLPAALMLVERVSRDCESISRAFTRLFLKELWEPFDEAG